MTGRAANSAIFSTKEWKNWSRAEPGSLTASLGQVSFGSSADGAVKSGAGNRTGR